MKMFKKKLTSMLLAVLLLLSLLPTTVLATTQFDNEPASNAEMSEGGEQTPSEEPSSALEPETSVAPMPEAPEGSAAQNTDGTPITTGTPGLSDEPIIKVPEDPVEQSPTIDPEENTVDPESETTEPSEDNLDESKEEKPEDTEISYAFSALGVEIGEEYVPVVLSSNAEDDIMPASLLPLKEYRGTLDLSTYMPEDLKAVKLKAVWDSLEGDAASVPENAKVMWSVRSSTGYQLLGTDGVMDLSDCYTLQLIVGPHADDQLDPSNVRYIISVDSPDLSNLFSLELYSAKTNKKLDIVDSYEGSDSYHFYVKHDYPEDIANLHILLNANNVQGVQLKELYARNAGSTDLGTKITDGQSQIRIGTDNTFNAILTKGKKTYTYTFYVYVTRASIYVHYATLTDENGDGVGNSVDWDWDNGVDIRTVMLEPDLPVGGKYFAKLEAENSEDSEMNDVDCIARAVIGHYSSLDEASSQPDVKEKLFGSKGYQADYSKGVEFSIFTIYGQINNIMIKTTTYSSSLSTSTNFYISSVYKSSRESGYAPAYSSYIISSTTDDSMGNIYQTVLLLDDGNPVTADVIYPTFYTPEGVTVFLGDETSGTKQESGKSPVPFTPGVPVLYSAASESGTHLQNYYVTFVTAANEQGELFVLGANAKDQNYDENEGVPGRVIHLGDLESPSTTYYDILFANIGQKELTGLYVKLENAKNVQIDNYWTVTDGSVKKLGAFSTTSSRDPDGEYASYGELPNLAKVRLLPEYDEDGDIKHGLISGYLVIGAEGVDEVRIKLTGISGKPKIITEEVVDGTKYVPYDTLIQTNNVGEPDAVKFVINAPVSADSEVLPEGLEIYPDGEIYGIPQTTGKYDIYVNLVTSDGREWLDSARFEFDILENTDDNVWNESDNGYEILDAVGAEVTNTHYILEEYSDQVFRSNGEYQYYVDFYLDGAKLTEGSDYTSKEGSTVITVLEETLVNAGKGTHTIAAEFHEKKTDNGKPDGSLKRTAQNYTVQLKPATTPKPTVKPTAKPTTVPDNPPAPEKDPTPPSGGDTGTTQVTTVTCEMHILDASNEPLANLPLELHSTPQSATTNAAGSATFGNVEFGDHVLYITDLAGNKASYAFKLVSDTNATGDDTIGVEPGSYVRLTLQLDGNTVVLVSVESTGPATGDSRPLRDYAIVFAISATALVLLGIIGRRRRTY